MNENTADQKIKLLHKKAKQLLKEKLTDQEVITALTLEGISPDYAELIIQNVQDDTVKRKAFWAHLMAGVSTCIATLFLNYLSYENTLPGGSYLIVWGTFTFGAVLIARAFILFRK